jgi:hypothetical protein
MRQRILRTEEDAYQLHNKASRMNEKEYTPPIVPTPPLPMDPFFMDQFAKCPKCGLVLTGALGYYCGTPNCPTGLGSPFCEDSSKTTT